MVGVLRFRNSETGEWQDINAIKGVPGDDYVLTQEDREEIAGLVGTEDFYTKAQIDERLENIEGGSVEINFSRGLNYNPDTKTVAVKAQSPVAFTNNGALTVNQDNLFNRGGAEWFLNKPVGPVPMNNTITTIDVEENLDEWFANLQDNEIVRCRFRTPDLGFGGGVGAMIQRGQSAINGISYDYLLDMTGCMNAETRAGIGILSIYMGYNTGIISFIFERDVSVALGDINNVELGEQVNVPSLAHYWIGRNQQWNITGNNNIEINEDYINELIDAKIDAIPVAEGVSV